MTHICVNRTLLYSYLICGKLQPLKWIKDWVLQLLLIQLKRSSAHAFYQQLCIKMQLKLLKSLALIPES